MKRMLAFLIIFSLCLSCTACVCLPVKGPTEPETEPPAALVTDPVEIAPQTEPATEPATEAATEPATEPTSTEPKNSVPYTTPLPASFDIFNLPGYYYRYVQDVGLTGVYTIVEEEYDEYGNLWGKLKSGVGWVQLSGIIPESNYTRTCPDCGLTEPDVFFDKEYESEYCDSCSYGKGNGGSVLFCWQCGADCTYRGVEEDGRCEDCYYGY